MNGLKSKQSGAGLLGWLTGLLVLGLSITLLSKVVPFYLDDYAIKKVVASLDEQTGSDDASIRQVRIWLEKGLKTNLIKMKPDELKVFKENGLTAVDIDYERRLNFLYNIDLILMFKHDWKAKNR
ncbi:hypothetical protein ACH42_14825 [Endozoicomonas sp. (ex Bugula neritina AB1)]|nr:hypothetical protein ACH42_14825 [Endozoicomonas sp. (ex Bugula neritina AB1)]